MEACGSEARRPGRRQQEVDGWRATPATSKKTVFDLVSGTVFFIAGGGLSRTPTKIYSIGSGLEKRYPCIVLREVVFIFSSCNSVSTPSATKSYP